MYVSLIQELVIPKACGNLILKMGQKKQIPGFPIFSDYGFTGFHKTLFFSKAEKAFVYCFLLAGSYKLCKCGHQKLGNHWSLKQKSEKHNCCGEAKIKTYAHLCRKNHNIHKLFCGKNHNILALQSQKSQFRRTGGHHFMIFFYHKIPFF